jgi:hypothetical protein
MNGDPRSAPNAGPGSAAQAGDDGHQASPGRNDPRAQSRFAEIEAAYAGDPRVSFGTGFGPNAGLRVNGHIVAMLVHGGLAVKLPSDRVAALIEAGRAGPFGMGKKRPMREWAALPMESMSDWPAIVAEAFTFVSKP